ncbi:Transposable element P transposase [Frankliniella fusca]|uniref:Transposable element P transposase n=1 Tax=Frankliniella fusca TaxID=407009 RepID=A0AAE1GVF4_9NEOP|nr:Transposable element P transposase [Frankliniella fusca]
MPDRCVVFGCSSGYDRDRQEREAKNLPQLSQFRPKKKTVAAETDTELIIEENFSKVQDILIAEEEVIDFLCDEPLSLLETILKDPDIVERPNHNWLIHKGPNFINYVCVNDVIQIDRYIKIRKGSSNPEVYLWQKRIMESSAATTLEDLTDLLREVDSLRACPGTGRNDWKRSDKCATYLAPGGSKMRLPPRCFECAKKRSVAAKRVRRQITTKFNREKKNLEKRQQKALLKRKVARRDSKINKVLKKLENAIEQCALVKKEKVQEYIKNFPPKLQQVILSCINAARAKTPNGRRYTLNWVYECQMLRIKSLALYKKMCRDNFLPLPSLRTLQRYMRRLKPAYGFQETTFEMLKEKSPLMTEAERHCALLIDEMKLTEGLWVDKSSLKTLGFVTLDKFTPEGQKDVPGDHALTFMLQGFQGQYFQTLSAHLSKGAVKGDALAKLILVAVRMTEAAGFVIDVVVTDAASWNRNMWMQFGLKKMPYEKQGSKKRYTFDDDEDDNDNDENFDFELAYPCRRKERKRKPKKPQSKKKTRTQEDVVDLEDIQTPDGKVKLNHWAIVVKEDDKKGIKVAPKLSAAHFQSESYATMSVKLAFSFFSEQAATAMLHYKRLGVAGMEDCDATVKFIRRVNVLIDSMNSNTRKYGLKEEILEDDVFFDPPICPECNLTHDENTPQRRRSSRQVIEDFLANLQTWETSSITRDKRLTANAAHGLRVTLTTALEISSYLIKNVGYEYFMTRRLNQDALEHFFGEVRQGCGAHGHPDPWQFIQMYRLMSFKNLVKPPRGSNVTGGDMLNALLSMPDAKSEENIRRQIELEKQIDEALDTGESISSPFNDHTYYENLTIDQGAIRFFGGYVARKLRRSTCAKTCEDCFKCVTAPQSQPLREDDDIIHGRSQGYLLIPSDGLMAIIEKLETAVLEVFQLSHLHEDLIFEVAESVKRKKYDEIGCNIHKRELTKATISFYMTTRLIFACEEYNKRLSANAKKKSKAKHQMKMFMLTC